MTIAATIIFPPWRGMWVALADKVRNKFLQTWKPVYGKEKTAQLLEGWWKVSEMSESKLVQEIPSLDVYRELFADN